MCFPFVYFSLHLIIHFRMCSSYYMKKPFKIFGEILLITNQFGINVYLYKSGNIKCTCHVHIFINLSLSILCFYDIEMLFVIKKFIQKKLIASHTVVSNNAKKQFLTFTQHPQIVTSCNTIEQDLQILSVRNSIDPLSSQTITCKDDIYLAT